MLQVQLYGKIGCKQKNRDGTCILLGQDGMQLCTATLLLFWFLATLVGQNLFYYVMCAGLPNSWFLVLSVWFEMCIPSQGSAAPWYGKFKKKGHFPSKRCFLWATDKSLGVFISKCVSCQHLLVSAKTTHWNKFLGHIYAFTAQDQGLELRDSRTEMFSPVDVAHTARPWMLHLMSTSRLTGFGTRVCPLTVLSVKG